MRNLKIRKGTLRFVRLPRHTGQEIYNIRLMHAPELKRRSRNRAAGKRARLARRVSRHGR